MDKGLEQPETKLGDGAKVLPMTPIKGYTPINLAEQRLINANKEMEERLLRVLDTLVGYGLDHPVDQRWLSIARTHFEQGFMALNRSIFRPQRIKLPDDVEVPKSG